MAFQVYGGNNNSGGSLTQQLIVDVGAGQSIGGAVNGEVFPAGTSLESILRDILIKAFNPTLSLSSDIATLMQEAGVIISPMFNSNFSQNDAGALLTKILKKNGGQISAVYPYQDLNVQLPDGDIIYISQANYSAGMIPAGGVSSATITYQGRRKIFGGTPGATPATSANVRSLTQNALDAQVGTQLIIPIAQGSTNVSFAYPASLPDVGNVLYVEFSNAEVKSLFTQSIVNVAGANGFTPISYKLYNFTPIQPFQTAVTYRVII